MYISLCMPFTICAKCVLLPVTFIHTRGQVKAEKLPVQLTRSRSRVVRRSSAHALILCASKCLKYGMREKKCNIPLEVPPEGDEIESLENHYHLRFRWRPCERFHAVLQNTHYRRRYVHTLRTYVRRYHACALGFPSVFQRHQRTYVRRMRIRFSVGFPTAPAYMSIRTSNLNSTSQKCS